MVAEQPRRAERKLVAILAADVAGYSRLIGLDEEGTLGLLRTLHHELIEPSIADHHGRIVKTTGDGILIEFTSVVAAVRSAIELQRGMATRNAGMPSDRRLEFRVGIHLGDVVVEGDGDLMGDGVNVAARLENMAPPGGICLSRAAYDQVRGKVDAAAHDMGDQRLKNIAAPVRVFRLDVDKHEAGDRSRLFGPRTLSAAVTTSLLALLGIGAATWYGTMGPAHVEMRSPPGIPPKSSSDLSIVVLPFANLSGDPMQDYFADGLTESLTSDLSRIPESFVIARNTAFTFRGKAVDVRQIGKELGVRYVLEGSVQRSGDQVRVNAQLIDADTGGHLWSERFDRPRGDLFELQDEITSRIARTLNLKLVALESSRIELEHRTDLTASDLAMQGWAAVLRPPTAENRQEARRLFERALNRDDRTVQALTGLAGVLANIVINGQSTTPAEDLRRADELASRAIALDPNGSDAHFERARVLQAQRRQTEAAEEYKIVIQLNRNAVWALVFLGETMVFTGRSAEAIPLIERAILLSPRDSGLGVWQFEMGRAMLLLKRDDDALAWLRKSVATNSRLAYGQLYLAAILAIKNEMSESRSALAAAGGLNPNYTTLARFRATDLSDNPTYVAQRGYVEDALRRAGLAEK